MIRKIKDPKVYFIKTESNRHFLDDLKRNVFGTTDGGAVERTCYYDGDFSNAYKIQRIVNSIFISNVIVRDEIILNQHICIEIEFVGFPLLPKIRIDIAKDKIEKFGLASRLELERSGMDFLYVPVLNAIYTMLGANKSGITKPNRTYTYYYDDFDYDTTVWQRDIPLRLKE